MVVLDTCAVIEAFKIKPSFTSKTLKKIEDRAVVLSISFAEIACKVKLGKLQMNISPRILLSELSQIETLEIINITPEHWLDSIELQWADNKDPADRIITSYAIQNNLAIVTTDQQIKQYYKKIIW